MKHHTSIATLGTIINSIDDHTASEWWEIVGIDIPGLDAVYASDDDADRERAAEIEAAYVNAHGDDIYAVTWPDHVTVPAYNSDASYCLVTDDYPTLSQGQLDIIAASMDDDIRERLHAALATCSPGEFLTAYMAADPHFPIRQFATASPYAVRASETGDLIDWFATEEDAIQAAERYAASDKADGIDVAGFYEVYDLVNSERIMIV